MQTCSSYAILKTLVFEKTVFLKMGFLTRDPMTYHFNFKLGKVRRGQVVPDNDALVQVIKLRPEILQQMLSTVLNIIMFEDCRNQWSMSRPLLGLILLNAEYFEQLRDQV